MMSEQSTCCGAPVFSRPDGTPYCSRCGVAQSAPKPEPAETETPLIPEPDSEEQGDA